jgi:hypothetical protein
MALLVASTKPGSCGFHAQFLRSHRDVTCGFPAAAGRFPPETGLRCAGHEGIRRSSTPANCKAADPLPAQFAMLQTELANPHAHA